MQTPNTGRKHQSLIILLSLVLCIILLISLEYFRPKPAEESLYAEAQMTENLPEEALSKSNSPSPSPTPEASLEVAVVESTFPDDPYPELYGDNPDQTFLPPEDKVVYLTFDDGPTTVTPKLLDVLLEEGVQATFFVVGKSPFKEEVLKRIYEENHTLGVHTMSHKYEEIYATVDNFYRDFAEEYNTIWEATGHRPRIFRFPGGSVNSYNSHLYHDLIWEMKRRGFVYYDWNVTSEDAVGVEDPYEQLQELITQSESKPRIIALLHDSETNPEIHTVVREYIHYMRQAGYRFEALDSNVAPIYFPLW